MPITFTCRCGKRLQVADAYAGQEGECPSCREPVLVRDTAVEPPAVNAFD